MEIEDNLKADQEFVGGRIEACSVTEDLILICNGDAVNNGLEERVVILGERDGEDDAIDMRGIRDIIHGDCFVCRFDGCDGFESIRNSDIETIKHYIKPVVSTANGVIEIAE